MTTRVIKKTTEVVNYIPEHEDFQIMKKVYLPEVIGLSKGVWNQAFDFLKDVLILTYGKCQFGLLVNAVEKNPIEEAKKISHNFLKISASNGWCEKTTLSVISNMKKIMKQTTININFINKLTTIKEKGIDRKSIEYCLPGKYKKYADDNPEKKLLILWLEKCKNDTRNKSQSSLKQIIQFTLKVCGVLNISLINFNEKQVQALPITTFQNIIDQIDLKIPKKTKIRFIIIVIKYFFNCNIPPSELDEWLKSIPKENNFIDNNNHNLKVSIKELEMMFETSKANIKDLVLFLLMTTTGLRVSSVSTLLLKNVSDINDDKINILNEGHILINGKKWYTFTICENLKKSLEKWIIEERSVLSEYLLPGSKQGSLSPSRISKIIKDIAVKAGLDSKNIHADSIRRSFASILLEGNEEDKLIIEKIMGTLCNKNMENFSKETVIEVSKRLNIPWLSKDSVQKDGIQQVIKKGKNKKK